MDNGEVILVTLNYRLGTFGFLCSGDEAVKGNFGLKDQQLALKWVASNIEAFGGDPNSVTLLGKTAGALSAHYHMMNSVSSALFHRIILMSGTAISPFAFSYDWKLRYRLSAKYSGLEGWDTASTYELANQLKSLDPIRLVLTMDLLYTMVLTPLTPLRPCIEGDWEGAFLRDDPRKIWAEGRFNQKPIFIGTTTDQGTIAAAITINQTRLNVFNENIHDFLPIQLDFDPKYVKEVLEYYLGKDYIDKSNFEAYYKMFGDRTMRYPLIKLVNQYLRYADVKQNPIYIYEFGFRSQYTFLKYATGANINLGVSHYDDYPYIFNMPSFFPLFHPHTPEGLMADTFVKTLVTFAVHGEVKAWAPFEQCTSNTNIPFCDRQIFERFNKTEPDSVIVSVTDQVNTEMVKFWNHIDKEFQ
ncbi:juvenile hormone esterase-like [Lutzomyia longipalpis]|uniref:juvenile hormone esterase-like n=1 Tax=Lutzomyia longipalpis TaxID=7200 RepID=UPI002483A463|nr:juvenile hormone esterase-like [Lutzomyia longipalpis]